MKHSNGRANERRDEIYKKRVKDKAQDLKLPDTRSRGRSK